MLFKKYFVQFFVIALLSFGAASVNFVFANTDASSADNANVVDPKDSSIRIMTDVNKDLALLDVDSFDERREQHKVLFYMGVLLLLFVLLTAGFGVSMAMLGKEVFVPHMICAGITVFLSIAHAVVAVVWFFPF